MIDTATLSANQRLRLQLALEKIPDVRFNVLEVVVRAEGGTIRNVAQ